MSSKDDSNRSGLEIYFTEKGKMNFRVIKPNREAEKVMEQSIMTQKELKNY